MVNKNTQLSSNQSAILIKLLEGEQKMKDLQGIVKNYLSLQKEIQNLEDLGLVNTTVKIEGRKSIYVSLTKKGETVAKKILEIDLLISGEKDAMENLNYISYLNGILNAVKYRFIYEGSVEEGEKIFKIEYCIPETRELVTVAPVMAFEVEDQEIDKFSLAKSKDFAKRLKGTDEIYGTIVLLMRSSKRKVALQCVSCNNSTTCHHVNFLWAQPDVRNKILKYAKDNMLEITHII